MTDDMLVLRKGVAELVTATLEARSSIYLESAIQEYKKKLSYRRRIMAQFDASMLNPVKAESTGTHQRPSISCEDSQLDALLPPEEPPERINAVLREHIERMNVQMARHADRLASEEEASPQLANLSQSSDTTATQTEDIDLPDPRTLKLATRRGGLRSADGNSSRDSSIDNSTTNGQIMHGYCVSISSSDAGDMDIENIPHHDSNKEIVRAVAVVKPQQQPVPTVVSSNRGRGRSRGTAPSQQPSSSSSSAVTSSPSRRGRGGRGRGNFTRGGTSPRSSLPSAATVSVPQAARATTATTSAPRSSRSANASVSSSTPPQLVSPTATATTSSPTALSPGQYGLRRRATKRTVCAAEYASSAESSPVTSPSRRRQRGGSRGSGGSAPVQQSVLPIQQNVRNSPSNVPANDFAPMFHGRQRNAQGEFDCDICRRTFTSESSWMFHYYTHSNTAS